jgi:carboxymethylenebutenolidase
MNFNVSFTHHDIKTPDGTCDTHVAVPDGDQEFPGVLFLMDAFGIRPVIDEWIKRIASHGYVVVAPNLLYRSARAPLFEDLSAELTEENRPKLFQRLMPMMQLLNPENVAKDTRAYLDFLKGLSATAPGPVALAGYCMGTRFALRAAADYPDEVALVAGFHGGNLATDQLDSPHLTVDRLKAEVYLAYADHDESASPEKRQRMEEALSSAGVTHVCEVYPDAPHGYTMSDTPSYREDAAERHFGKLIELLERKLG